MPKSYEPRALPLARIVHDPLYEHFKRSRWNKPDDLVFPHPDTGRELDGAALNDRFKRAVIAAHIRPHEYETRRRKTSSGKYRPWTHTPITWHDLRHAFGTFLAANGFASATIEEWCGWADKKTMKRYPHYRPGGSELAQLNAAIQRDQERNSRDRPPTTAASAGNPAKLPGLTDGARGGQEDARSGAGRTSKPCLTNWSPRASRPTAGTTKVSICSRTARRIRAAAPRSAGTSAG